MADDLVIWRAICGMERAREVAVGKSFKPHTAAAAQCLTFHVLSTHATRLPTLPLDVSIAPRSALDPASCVRGWPIQSLFCVKAIRTITQVVHCIRLSRATSDDGRG